MPESPRVTGILNGLYYEAWVEYVISSPNPVGRGSNVAVSWRFFCKKLSDGSIILNGVDEGILRCWTGGPVGGSNFHYFNSRDVSWKSEHLIDTLTAGGGAGGAPSRIDSLYATIYVASESSTPTSYEQQVRIFFRTHTDKNSLPFSSDSFSPTVVFTPKGSKVPAGTAASS